MTVAIIGVGGFGVRHLQSVVRVDRDVNIFVVDSSSDSIKTAKHYYDEVSHENVISIEFCNNIDRLPLSLDVAIIATSSLPRRQLAMKILENRQISHIVLEKFLFPAIEDYGDVAEFFSLFPRCKVWVNCSRRMNEFYINLRSKLKHEFINNFIVKGTSWGMGCNAIHFVDLLAYLLFDSDGFIFDCSKLDKEYTSSKRDNYIEFTGALVGQAPKCPYILIESKAGQRSPVHIYLEGPGFKCEVDETEGTAVISRKSSAWREETIDFNLKPQSQLTNILVQQLMDTGHCLLPTFEESAKLHLALLQTFFAHMNSINGESVALCPIT